MTTAPTLHASTFRFPARKWIRYAAVFLLILGTKLWIIRGYGSDIPFSDQWRGEALTVYKPFLEGTLSWSSLFSAFSEHRILFTRLLFLLLLKVNGVWDPVLEMVVQAVIFSATVVWLLELCALELRGAIRTVFLCVGCVMWLPPFAFENTLWGFQSQFYFVFLFGIAGLWLTWRRETLSAGWWGGVGVLLAGIFTMASGVLATAAAAALLLARLWENPHQWRRQVCGLGVLAAILIGGILLVPHVEYYDQFKARNAVELLQALGRALSWPCEARWLCLILQAPAVLLGVMVIRRRIPTRDGAWLVLVLVAWGWLQALAISYGRARFTTIPPRYLDTFVLTLCASFACLCLWSQKFWDQPRQRWKALPICAWVFVAAQAAVLYFGNETSDQIGEYRKMLRGDEAIVRSYLESHDPAMLATRTVINPEPEMVKSCLDDPTLAEILPPRLRPALSCSRQMSEDSFFTRSYFDEGGRPTPDQERYWSSYGPAGMTHQGELELKFAGSKRSRWLEFFVSGNPNAQGISLLLTDRKGQTHNLAPAGDPGKLWEPVLVRVPPGAFVVRTKDGSPGAWIALSDPRETGLLSHLVERLFAWADNTPGVVLLPMVIAMGLTLLILAILCAPEETNPA